MPKYVDIAQLTEDVLASVAEDRTKTAADETTATLKTDVGRELKTAADLLRNLQIPDVSDEDLHNAVVGVKVAAHSAPVTTAKSEMGLALRKLGVDLRTASVTDSEQRLSKAASMLTAAVGLQHLINRR